MGDTYTIMNETNLNLIVEVCLTEGQLRLNSNYENVLELLKQDANLSDAHLRLKLINLFLDKVANIELIPKHIMFSILKYLVINDQAETLNKLDYKYLNLRDWYSGETLMHVASYNGNLKIVQLLYNKKISVYSTDSEGCLPIHYAVVQNYVNLLEWFCSIDRALIISKNNYNWTPAYIAIQNYSIKSLIYIISSHIDNIENIIQYLCEDETYYHYLKNYDKKNDENHTNLLGILEPLIL